MTLGELIDLVCVKTHRTDEQTRAEVRKYITARYKMIWDSRPWRDATALVAVPLSMVEQVTILPGIIDRVQEVRWDDGTLLSVDELRSVMVLNPSRFNEQGMPAHFSIISPSAVQVSPGGGQVTVKSTDANADYRVSIRGMVGHLERFEHLAVAGTSPITSVHSYDEITSLSKSSNTYDLQVSDQSGEEILFLAADQTSQAFQRIHFHVQPTDAKALLVLAKKRFRPLIEDSDATELTGIDNALLAAAIADVLEGQRQYGKAQAKMSEAVELMNQMADQEVGQSASNIRLIPYEDGGGYWEGHGSNL